MARFDVEEQIKLEEELDSLQRDLRLEERRVKVYEFSRGVFIPSEERCFFSSKRGFRK